MTSLLVAAIGAYGVHLVYTALVLRWTGIAPGPNVPSADRVRSRRLNDWLAQAGLNEVRPSELGSVVFVLALAGGAGAFALFGGMVPTAVAGAFAGCTPLVSYRVRRRTRMAAAQEAWPRMIEEIRVLTGSLGRSVPQALFEVGRRGPVELRSAFIDGHREWLLTTDFPRVVALLKSRLADATADATLETLLVAHELGGTTLDRRLEALAVDRQSDVLGRKEAEAKQSGVRFARRFVLIVPVGMAVVGLQIGEGRAAYQSGGGQLAVAVALILVVVCWGWAGRMLRLPTEARVFHR
jgi:tight adherence protein B